MVTAEFILAIHADSTQTLSLLKVRGAAVGRVSVTASCRVVDDSERVDCCCVCSQINVSSVEELESFSEQIMAVPVLMRIVAHFFNNDFVGPVMPERPFEGASVSLR